MVLVIPQAPKLEALVPPQAMQRRSWSLRPGTLYCPAPPKKQLQGFTVGRLLLNPTLYTWSVRTIDKPISKLGDFAGCRLRSVTGVWK